MSAVKEDRELRFGLVGCGHVVQDLHLPAWNSIPDVKLVAICDSSPASLEAVAQFAPTARRYRNVADFIDENDDLSFVVLATPGNTHPELGRQFLGKGINLLCEKPLALNASDAQALYAMADETGAMLTVIHNYRFKENTQQALRAMQQGLLGDTVAVNLKFRSGPLFGDQARWRRDERQHRTLLFDYAIHLVDIAILFLGPSTSVRFVDADVDSAGIQRVVFGSLHQNGSRGVFDLMLDAASASAELEVLGESSGLSMQFFPQGVRLLPSRDNPLARLLSEGRRLSDYARVSLGDRLFRHRCSSRARSHADLSVHSLVLFGGRARIRFGCRDNADYSIAGRSCLPSLPS